jgi:hypothetical protein
MTDTPEKADLNHKGIVFLKKLKQELDSPTAKSTKFVYKEIMLNKALFKLPKMTPTNAIVTITSVQLQKALMAAGFMQKSECIDALTSLAGDFGMAAALGPETAGLGALLPLALAAVDSYDVGQKCFSSGGGPTTHAVRPVIERGLKSPAGGGPI